MTNEWTLLAFLKILYSIDDSFWSSFHDEKSMSVDGRFVLVCIVLL